MTEGLEPPLNITLILCRTARLIEGGDGGGDSGDGEAGKIPDTVYFDREL
eukprot:CAMPEP_0185778312 /NCGR_PEP_ID=MMETSP1174-20130828/92134_1 /TAXON_ID=35687 /ORGANISM="Dictyocha speculum, Strain CCMP1381" /LENGTH=49 /DNA_ID=CAMNT_0028466973 /DNA_START=537 /DNA_END=686 /DNA_ORIENTATION=+